MKYKFTAIFQKEGRWYVGRSIQAGVTSQGRTLNSAKKNLIEAVELFHEEAEIEEIEIKDRGVRKKVARIAKLLK